MRFLNLTWLCSFPKFYPKFSAISYMTVSYNWILRVPQKVFPAFDNIFHVYLMRRLQKYARIWNITMSFWATSVHTCKIGQSILPIASSFCPILVCLKKPPWLNCLSAHTYFSDSPHQVDMKNMVKYCKEFLWYSNTLKTYLALCFN